MSPVPMTLLALVLTCLLAGLPGPAAHAGHPTVTPLDPPGTGHAPDGSGVWPVEPPAVLRGFDPPTSAYGAGHRGVDLAARAGQPVRAALGGRVTFAGSLAGRGVVVVGHGGTRTTYEPVSPTVGVGDAVVRGATLGRLQRAGSHCAPATCLHWGLIEGASTYRDPLRLVGAGPVRLLPFLAGRTLDAPRSRAFRARTRGFFTARPPGVERRRTLTMWAV